MKLRVPMNIFCGNNFQKARKMQSLINGSAKACLVLLGIGIGSHATNAAILEVGVSQTYTTIQAAYNAAGAGDTIQVHGGTYGSGGVVLNGRGGLGFNDSHPNRSGLVIEAYGDGRVFLNGNIEFFGTSDGNIGGVTIKDMFIKPVTSGTAGIWVRSDTTATLKGMTLTNNVVYGSNFGSGIYVFGGGTHGQHTIEHNTVVGGSAGSIAFRDSANSSVQPVPIWRSNLAIDANIGFDSGLAGSSSTGVGPDGRFSYSDAFGNTTADYGSGNPIVKGTGTISIDPVFASIVETDPDFLNLSASTPVSVLTGAHDGTFIGALGVVSVPEPASLVLLCVGLGFINKRNATR